MECRGIVDDRHSGVLGMESPPLFDRTSDNGANSNGDDADDADDDADNIDAVDVDECVGGLDDDDDDDSFDAVAKARSWLIASLCTSDDDCIVWLRPSVNGGNVSSSARSSSSSSFACVAFVLT